MSADEPDSPPPPADTLETSPQDVYKLVLWLVLGIAFIILLVGGALFLWDRRGRIRAAMVRWRRNASDESLPWDNNPPPDILETSFDGEDAHPGRQVHWGPPSQERLIELQPVHVRAPHEERSSRFPVASLPRSVTEGGPA